MNVQTRTKTLIQSPSFSFDTPWTEDRVEVGEALLHAVLDEFPTGSTLVADWSRLRTAGRFHREVKAVADRVGQSWRTIMLANLSYDLAMFALGCSTMAVVSEDGPVLARNLDWWPEAELMAASERVQDENGNIRATWPGFVGVVTGMSSRGFALALNAVGSSERAAVTGYPVLLLLRRVLDDAKDFDEAVHILSRQVIAAPALFTLVGTENTERVVIERTPRKARLRWAQGREPLIATNDYRLMTEKGDQVHELYTTACGRYDALTACAQELSAEQSCDDLVLLDALTHDKVFQQITVQHVIARPKSQCLGVWTPSTM